MDSFYNAVSSPDEILQHLVANLFMSSSFNQVCNQMCSDSFFGIYFNNYSGLKTLRNGQKRSGKDRWMPEIVRIVKNVHAIHDRYCPKLFQNRVHASKTKKSLQLNSEITILPSKTNDLYQSYK
jgi:hypothetical protein